MANRVSKHLKSLDLNRRDRRVRLLAFLSAAITVCQPKITEVVLKHLKKAKIDPTAVYETIIQSYLFLGFPRMIEAAFIYHKVYGLDREKRPLQAPTATTVKTWFNNGLRLCRRVYGKNYGILRDKMMAIGPEIFEWMVLEGYGKVLTRPGLTQIERELAEVAALITDGRERQLISHVLGSLHVGADFDLIRQVSSDISCISGKKPMALANKVISRIENNYAAAK